MTERINTRIVAPSLRAYRAARARLLCIQGQLTGQPVVAYVSDGAGWIIDEVGHQIARRVQDRYLMRVVQGYRGYRGAIVHFAEPSLLTREAYRTLHPSNRLLLTWTHGLPNNPDPAIERRINDICYGHSQIARIKVQTTTAREFLIGLGVNAAKIVHIPLGVDTKLFAPPSKDQRADARTRLGIPEDALVIGSFQKDSPGWNNQSREMKWVKGPDVLADVIELLASSFKVFALLTTPSRGYLIERLERARIPYRHVILGATHELTSYYHALDLYLITSRDEGGPMSLLEAMASGVPVVSTRIGIPKDAVRHRENGLLADIDDVEGLTAAAREVLGTKEWADRLAQAGRQTALTYDWSLIADKYAGMLYNFHLADGEERIG